MTAETAEEKVRSGRLASTATAASIMWLAEWAVLWGDPNYDAPEGPLDYAAAIVFSLALFATAIALFVVQREVAPRRASALISLAAIAALVTSVGNLLEDVFGVAAADDIFIYGGFVFFAALALSGVLTVTTPAPQRWVGIVLLVNAGAFGLGWTAPMIIGWFWLASAARRGRFDEIASSQ